MSTPQSREQIPPDAHWLLEGGDDPWDDLMGAITRCLDEVVAGGVLEVISWAPGVELNVASWCWEAGHQLLHVLKEGAWTRVWIEKGERTAECSASITHRDH